MDVSVYNENQQVIEQLVCLIFFFLWGAINCFIVKRSLQGKLEKHMQCMDLVQ